MRNLSLPNKEHVYQCSGAVMDEQIKDLGKQIGAQYLCVAEISEVEGGTYYLDARLIDVVTAKTVSSATAGSNLADINEMIRVAQELADDLIGGKSAERRAVSGRLTVDGAMAPKPAASGGPYIAEFTDLKTGMEMVFVRGGTFTMGCAPEHGNCQEHEKPTQSKYPVTQKLWYDVMGTTVRRQRDNTFMNSKEPLNGEGDNYPMYYVSHKLAKEFISALNAMTGKRYRMPTEAEWEYAARSGDKSRSYAFAGSDNIDEAGWYYGNSGDKPLETDADFWKMEEKKKNRIMSSNNNRLRPVGGKKPNELGIYDMSGGVMEWVSDYYDGEYYAESPKDNPKGPKQEDGETERVVRGGSWREEASRCRVSARWRYPADLGGIDVGFRLVLPAER